MVGGKWRRKTGWLSARLRAAAAGVLALMLAMGVWTGGARAAGGSADVAAGPARAQLDEALASLQAGLSTADPVSDWVAFGLARGGKPAASRYLKQAEKSANELRLVTDYARVALAVNASGGDVRSFGAGKVDLLAKIAGFEKMTAQGPNAPAYALLALDAGGYMPGLSDRWSRDSLLKWLVEHRNADGGWSLSPGKSDVDVTGIVLTALAPYKERDDIRPVVESALGWLSGVQLGSAGFGGTSSESSESSVQVLLALTSLGIDPEKDERFVKNGKSTVARFMEFRQSDGRFAHAPGGKADGFASLYALLGLTAVERFQDGLPGLYAGIPAGVQADVYVYGPKAELVQGRVTGRTALDSLLGLLRSHSVAYKVTKHPQFGAFLADVADVNATAGGLNGYWNYAVDRRGAWVDITEGLGSFVPQAGDRIFVYYAGADTSLIHSVKLEPAAPREGQPVKVTVEKEVVDWNTGKKVISPAEGAHIKAAGQSVTTDKDGKAELTPFKAGTFTLNVDGFRDGQTPLYAAVQLPLEVASYVKNVTVRVEGDHGPVVSGKAKGGTAYEALMSLLTAKNITPEIKKFSFGDYVNSINGITAGKYGGYDGWNAAVIRGGQWVVPEVGMDAFLLEDGDKVVVYFGNYGEATKLVHSVVVSPAYPKPGEAFSVAVTYRAGNASAGEIKPLAGAKVSVGSAEVVTDEQGVAQFSGGVPEALYKLSVTGYAKDAAPGVVRYADVLTIAKRYSDDKSVSGWAWESIYETRAAAVMKGPADSLAAFKPKQNATRAEFVSALARAMGLEPVKRKSIFKDVSAKAWYAADVEAAAKAGLVSGTAPGVFAPEAKLTREQAAMLVTRALKLSGTQTVALADAAQVSPVAKPAVQAVMERGLLTAYNGKFLPKASVTREQAAAIADRIMNEPEFGLLSK